MKKTIKTVALDAITTGSLSTLLQQGNKVRVTGVTQDGHEVHSPVISTKKAQIRIASSTGEQPSPDELQIASRALAADSGFTGFTSSDETTA